MNDVTAPKSARSCMLVQAACRGDSSARERVVADRLEEVRAIALRYRNLGLSMDDLVQEGCIGLLDAVDRYDPVGHPDFDAFARFRIRRAIRNALTEQSRFVRLPKHVVARRRLLARKEDELRAAEGKPPTSSELAAATGLSVAAVAAARAATIEQVPLERAATAELVGPDHATPDPAHEVIAAERSCTVRRAVDRLGERQREVIRRRFGLEDEEASVAALSRDLHVSERRTRTIEHDALRILAGGLEAVLGDE